MRPVRLTIVIAVYLSGLVAGLSPELGGRSC